MRFLSTLHITITLTLLTLTRLSQGQEIPPLLLDEDSSIKIRETTAPPKEDSTKVGEEEPEVDPEKELIALVNTRILTRAELDRRVSAAYQRVLENIQSQEGGVVANFAPGEEINLDRMSKHEILEEQEEELRAAMRQEEREAVKYWVDFALLAEEARRQGIIVSQSEFEQRLSQIEERNRIDQSYLESVLQGMEMSRREYERYIYDALLIDRMLRRFVNLNYDEEAMQRAYERKPSLFYEPARYKLAHFTVTMDEGMSKRKISQRTDIAKDVRSLLRKDEDPETIFARKEFNATDDGIAGSVPGWFTFKENALPKIVAWHGQRLDVGETSDVIENKARGSDGEVYTKSLHVIKMLDYKEPTGRTYETAKPTIEERMVELAQIKILERLREAATHKVMYSLSGIRPDRIPTQEELLRLERSAQPVSLKLPENAGANESL